MEENHEDTIEVREEQDSRICTADIEYEEIRVLKKDQILEAVLELLSMHKHTQTIVGKTDEDIVVNQVYDDLDEVLELYKKRDDDDFHSEWMERMETLAEKYKKRFYAESRF